MVSLIGVPFIVELHCMSTIAPWCASCVGQMITRPGTQFIKRQLTRRGQHYSSNWQVKKNFTIHHSDVFFIAKQDDHSLLIGDLLFIRSLRRSCHSESLIISRSLLERPSFLFYIFVMRVKWIILVRHFLLAKVSWVSYQICCEVVTKFLLR